ncbi:hypothetical protein [Halomonas sp. HAL1]|uniref:hypothetical protein n=1 Tax=Halomonas sp. HAL1 TaxID=550984 RepID=UPI00022D3452|nr:hypothetical protein [Halomonas sp. HAL1]EHA15563.1 hypothetical protein HAL1_09892 [Halomonas sp. HAL1]WKV91235.1 hypothetical protein Q3Y66_09990 [Halomonas sp. HAL1]
MPTDNSNTSSIPRSIFSIQTENVRELEKAWEQGNRLVNESLRSSDQASISIQTKLMALLFSAYTEAIFSKLIHTPSALNQQEIDLLKGKFKQNSYLGWVECLKLVVNKITAKDQAHKDQVIYEVKNLLNTYIKKPNEVRNRMAHGQWVVALNSYNTQENEAVTEKIRDLDIVVLTRYKKSFFLMALIIEDLIESPDKAHVNSYQNSVDKFNREQAKMASWTLQGRVQKLKPKPTFCENCITK